MIIGGLSHAWSPNAAVIVITDHEEATLDALLVAVVESTLPVGTEHERVLREALEEALRLLDFHWPDG